MPTTIHVPDALLAAVQRRAEALGISRNRLIVRALEREVRDVSAWSPGFIDALREVDAETAEAVDDLVSSVRRRRGSKPPPSL